MKFELPNRAVGICTELQTFHIWKYLDGGDLAILTRVTRRDL